MFNVGDTVMIKSSLTVDEAIRLIDLKVGINDEMKNLLRNFRYFTVAYVCRDDNTMNFTQDGRRWTWHMNAFELFSDKELKKEVW